MFLGNFSHTKKCFSDFSVSRENISIEFFLMAPFFPVISRTIEKYFPDFPGWEKISWNFFTANNYLQEICVTFSLCCSINSHNSTYTRIASLPVPETKHRITKTIPHPSCSGPRRMHKDLRTCVPPLLSHALLNLHNISGSRGQSFYMERFFR